MSHRDGDGDAFSRVSRLLTALGHEVIVGHAQKVRLITKSRRKDDRLDARTLARLARIDPELLSRVTAASAVGQWRGLRTAAQ